MSAAAAAVGSGGPQRGGWVGRAVAKLVVFVAVLLFLGGLWEGFKAFGAAVDLSWPFPVNDRTMPHLADIVGQLFEPARRNGPLLITVLLRAAGSTAQKAALGFAMGAAGGFVLGILIAHSRLLERGLLPYLVASQTVPILAIAPMVVVWLGAGLFSVAIIAAYLTFFPVTINTLRGLRSADPRAHELMRSYAANRWDVLWKLRVPASLPYVFTALKIAGPASVVGTIIGELPSSIQSGLAGLILNYNIYYSTLPAALWATIVVASLLGIGFYGAVALAERLLIHRAPERVT